MELGEKLVVRVLGVEEGVEMQEWALREGAKASSGAGARGGLQSVDEFGQSGREREESGNTVSTGADSDSLPGAVASSTSRRDDQLYPTSNNSANNNNYQRERTSCKPSSFLSVSLVGLVLRFILHYQLVYQLHLPSLLSLCRPPRRTILDRSTRARLPLNRDRNSVQNSLPSLEAGKRIKRKSKTLEIARVRSRILRGTTLSATTTLLQFLLPPRFVRVEEAMVPSHLPPWNVIYRTGVMVQICWEVEWMELKGTELIKHLYNLLL